jgi:hypothetical protein
MNQHTKHYRIKKPHRFLSLVLAVMYLLIPIFFAFHHDVRTEANHSISSSTKKAEFKHHCEICHFVVHKQSKFASGAKALALIYYAPKPVTIIPFFRCKIERSFLPGFTNKGPPLS